MKNRVLSLFLAVVLALGIMVPACADAVNDNPEYQDWSWRGVLDITNIHSISTTEDADGIPLEILHTTAPTTLTLRRDVEVPDLGTCVEKLVDGQWVVVPLTSGTETADGAISAGATYVLDAGTYYLFTANASHCIYIVVEEDSVLPQPPVPETFTDVANDAYYAEPVTWAVINGITSGMGDGLFAPDLPCTRAQIATFLWRTFGSPEPVSTSNPFSDVSPNAYYYKAVLWAVEEGITGGMGGGRGDRTEGSSGDMFGNMFGGDGSEMPDMSGMFGGGEMPDMGSMPQGGGFPGGDMQMPEGMEIPEGMQMPDGMSFGGSGYSGTSTSSPATIILLVASVIVLLIGLLVAYKFKR